MENTNKRLPTVVLSVLVTLLMAPGAFSQQQKTAEDPDQEKKLQEYIDKQIETLEISLKLEPLQVFYVDSIMNHDYKEMQKELQKLSSSKVSNADIYTMTRDKWSERMYQAFSKVFTEEQWRKYQKGGAGKQHKLREKRKAKMGMDSAGK